MEAAYENISGSPQLQAFVDTQGFGRDDHAVPEIVAAVYEAARCHLRPDAWLESCLKGQEEARDAGQTTWGKYLMDRLQAYLADQGGAAPPCAAAGMDPGGPGTQMAPTLEENLRQLESLRACRTWEEVRTHQITDFGRLAAVRKPRDPDLAERIKALRKACWEGVKSSPGPPLRWIPRDCWLTWTSPIWPCRVWCSWFGTSQGSMRGENAAAGCWISGTWSTGPWSCFWGKLGDSPTRAAGGNWAAVPGSDGG